MRIAREAADWAAQFIVLIFATSNVAMPYVIPSGSMEGTLMTGDHVLVDKLTYAPHGSVAVKLLPYSDVRRGDIVVFRYPLDIRKDLVKRVIGIPGDRIRLRDGVVIRNGMKISEPYVRHIDGAPRDPYRDNFPSGSAPLPERALAMLQDDVRGGDLVVPAGSYFVMGDNRDNSADSRYWGLVPRENITGKPIVVIWSYDAPTEDLLDFNVRHMVDLAEHFFTKTRWSRTFRLVRPG
jgi:signal peptidase I